MKKAIRLLTFSLLLMTTVLLFGGLRIEAEGNTLTLTDSSELVVAPGRVFTTTLEIRNAADVVGFQFKIDYNAAVFELIGLEKDSNLSGNIVYNIDNEGTIIVNYSDIGSPITGTKAILTLSFKTMPFYTTGTHNLLSIDESYENLFVTMSPTYQLTEVSDIAFSFNSVKIGKYGDVNLDDRISIIDVAMIQLHIAGKITLNTSQIALADVNLDFSVSIFDALLIQLFLVGKVEYLGDPGLEAENPVFIGVQNVEILVGTPFDVLHGVIALDEQEGNITSLMTVSGSVNVDLIGNYPIVYTVTNSFGKTTTVTRYINVVSEIPAVYANGTFNYKHANTELRHTFFAAAEKYLLNNLYGGIPVFANSGFNLYSSRIQLPVQQFIPIIGWGAPYSTMNADDASVIMDNNAFGQAGKYTYRAAISTNPVTFNQWLYNDSVSAEVITPFLDTLYTYEINDDNLSYSLVPSMASGAPVPINPTTLDSGKVVASTWRIPIREGLTWKYHQDTATSGFPAGHEVINAHDFVNTYKLALDNGWFRAISGGSHFWATTSPVTGAKAYRDAIVAGSGADWDSVGIKVIDNQTIEFKFDADLSDWNIRQWLSSFILTPINLELYAQVGSSYGTTAQTTAYHGYYQLEVFERDQVLRYTKNPLFHDQDKYFFTGQNLVIITDASIRFQEFVAGKLDFATLPTERYDSFKNHPGLKQVPGATTFRIMINGFGTPQAQEARFPGSGYIPEPLLANQNFKKAMYFAVDREKLAKEVLKTSQTQQFLFTHAYLVDPESGIAFRDTPQGQAVGEGLSVETNGYDFEAAVAFYKTAIAELVADGIYTPGTASSPRIIEVKLFIFTGSAAQVLFGDYIKSAFEAAFKDNVNHINVQITVESKAFPGIYYDFMMTGLFDLSIGGISGSTLDAAAFLNVFSSDNRGGFTLNWGIDTSVPEIEVLYTNNAGQLVKEIWSYDAIVSVLVGEVVVIDGRESVPSA